MQSLPGVTVTLLRAYRGEHPGRVYWRLGDDSRPSPSLQLDLGVADCSYKNVSGSERTLGWFQLGVYNTGFCLF